MVSPFGLSSAARAFARTYEIGARVSLWVGERLGAPESSVALRVLYCSSSFRSNLRKLDATILSAARISWVRSVSSHSNRLAPQGASLICSRLTGPTAVVAPSVLEFPDSTYSLCFRGGTMVLSNSFESFGSLSFFETPHCAVRCDVATAMPLPGLRDAPLSAASVKTSARNRR